MQLDKRLAAMKDLTALVEAANQDDLVAASRSGAMTVEPRKSAALADWFVRNNVVNGLFGENMHQEVVKRCGAVLSFLAVRGKLLPEHVSAMLDSTRGKHESTVLVCNLLCCASVADMAVTCDFAFW